MGLLLAPPPPAAPVEPPLYTGSFVGVEAAAGAALARSAVGPDLELGVRASSVLQAADLALRYEWAHVEGTAQHRLMVAAQLHPFFFFLLGNDRLWLTLASVYARLALGGEHIGGGAGLSAAWDWGAGIETPLTEPDAGDSFWLGLEYRRTSALDAPAWEDTPVSGVVLRLGWRFNAI